MALLTDVTDRIDNTRLIQLTNPRGTGKGATRDDTLLALAVSDVEGAFKVHVGKEYDTSDDRHVGPGVLGVLLALEMYKGSSKAADRWDAYTGRLREHLRMVTANDRIRPKGSSTLKPTTERSGNLPLFDPGAGFLDLLPAGPELKTNQFPWQGPTVP